MNFTPTPEQEAALELFLKGSSLAIEAGAGTGKTSTLQLLASKAKGRGQYIAFNKAIVGEATAKMPRNVQCRTAHSLAFQAVGRTYKHRLQSTARMRSDEIARHLGIGAMSVKYHDDQRLFLPGRLAGLVMQAIKRFCQSGDPEPTKKHVPYILGIDDVAEDGKRLYYNNDQVRGHIEEHIKKAWADILNPNGVLRYEHDHYLKTWQLQGPRIDADFILFDEAQDANPVLLAIVQAQKDAQIVWVGDSCQQIYEFTGAINAMANVTADARTFLTQSFRFGPAVAGVANQVLEMLRAELRLTGSPSIASTVGPVASPDAMLFRTNAAAVRAALAAQKDRKLVHIIGGAADVVSFTKAALALQRGQRTDHPELACFTSWYEVQEYVDRDPLGEELRLLVSLIEEFKGEVILEALGRCVQPDYAELVLSTAHKAKGLEWGAVKLGADFMPKPVEGETKPRLSPAELRLLYVAITRAKFELDIESLRVLLGATLEAV